MAALNFPISPSINDTYSNGTQTWLWNGTMWKTAGQIGPTGPTGSAGSAGNDLPKITAVTYTDSSYTSNESSIVSTSGGYIKLTGSNFQSGCTVTVGTVAATATYVSSTTVNVAVPATTAGTYHVYLVNPDGGSTLRVNGIVYANALGGTITTSGSYTIHTFTNSGTFSLAASKTIDYLIVAGGGGGSYDRAGGGAGGLIYLTSQSISAGSYSITVGAGGACGPSGAAAASKGTDSTFNSQTAYGGGAGGTFGQPTETVRNGGSGGGGDCNAAVSNYAGGTGVAGQGYAGGYGWSNDTVNGYGGGGGGGAGGAGASATFSSSSVGGNGGIGVANSISGSSTYYASGGAGRGNSGSGTASAGGGGGVQQNGTANTGGGGGASWGAVNGVGGSGIVIIRYLT